MRRIGTYLQVTLAYSEKVAPLCGVRDGLSWQGADELEYHLRIFETIGILGVLVITLTDMVGGVEESAGQQSTYQLAQGLAKVLITLISNNAPATTPRYDGHAIDIALGLLALTSAGFHSEAASWVDGLSARALWAYQLGWHFPIYTDFYDDLVAMRFGQAPPKEKLMKLSTLLPMLAHWYAVLDMAETYEGFRSSIAEVFTETDLQLWFPDQGTDDHLFRENAGFTSGATLSSIQLPGSLDELKAHIVRLHEERREFESLSCFEKGWPILGLIASRHHRTPVIPAYWQRSVAVPSAEEQPAD